MNRPTVNRTYTATLAALVLTALLSCGCATHDGPRFSHAVTTEAKPWTHLNFHNDPEDFQFAIVTDRTGGHRKGVFPAAVAKLNLLRPEFVLTVGDMIEGYHEDEHRLRKEWDEFNGFVANLDMPFFYLPGNHDNINPTMKRLYLEQFGQAYYAFVYRDVLFLSLDTQDVQPAGLGDDQVAWAIETLRKHADARWTFILMHQPLWVHEEGHLRTARKNIGAPRKTGYGAIQQELGDRNYTVFAGHFHQYAKFVRNQRNHFILATTGGTSRLRGPSFGEFDHCVWITLTPDGPVMANLLLEGIRDEDVFTETELRFTGQLAFQSDDAFEPGRPQTLALPVVNTFDHVMAVELTWTAPEDADWRIQPNPGRFDVPARGSLTIETELTYRGDDPAPLLPTCTGAFTAGHHFMKEVEIGVKLPMKEAP